MCSTHTVFVVLFYERCVQVVLSNFYLNFQRQNLNEILNKIVINLNLDNRFVHVGKTAKKYDVFYHMNGPNIWIIDKVGMEPIFLFYPNSIPCNLDMKQRQITFRILGYHFSSRLTANHDLCPIYLKLLVHVL